MRRVRGLRSWRELSPFLGLCLLGATRWLLEGASSDAASTLWSEAFGCLSAAGVVALMNRTSRVRGAVEARSIEAGRGPGASGILGAVLVLTGPLLGEQVAGRPISASAATLSMALTPVALAVLTGVLGPEPKQDLPGRLWPGLAGLAGLLLLLPQPTYAGLRPWIGLSLMPLLTGAGAALCLGQREGDESGREPDEGFAAGCVLAALMFAGVALARHEPAGESEHLAGIALDASAVFLNLWSLRVLGAPRWSAQFLIIPVLSLLESVVFLHVLLDIRSWVGLGLVLTGSMRQLLSSWPETDQLVSLQESGE